MNLKKLSDEMRAKIISLSNKAKTPHLASSLSCIDIIVSIYEKVLRFDLNKENFKERDRFILSKGHAATALYTVLNYKGIITDSEIEGYATKGSLLEEHPSPKLRGIEAATGSLGHGLPIGCGISLAAKILKKNYMTFILMSDGECNEGSVWEAALFAPSKRLSNLCAIVDFNQWQATGRSKEIMSLYPLKEKFRNFGWNVNEIDGHNHDEVVNACLAAKSQDNAPSIIIANTVKGKGISFMEDDNNWHYRVPTDEEVKKCYIELGIK